MTLPQRVQNLVIGGGLAGSALAMRLAGAGREVWLLEKEREAHHKVCGEFLSREAVQYLRLLGVEPLDLGAHAIQRVRLYSGAREVEARLPFTALSLSRRVLDETLLLKAESGGSHVLRGACVERLERHGGTWCARLRGGATLAADSVFLATGKHDLNGWERRGATQGDLVGFKMHWNVERSQAEKLRGTMELLLFPGGYGGLSLVEAGVANLCVVMQRRTLRALGGWTELLRKMRKEVPALDERLQEGVPFWEKPLAISPIPYGHLGGLSDGIWRLGDQAAVIPSFTGDGMSIALHSAALAAEMYLNGKAADEYIVCLTSQLRAGMGFASALSRAMVTAPARAVAPFLLALLPGAMGKIALSTRIPDRALLTTAV
jgi:flavin-dependent dehydrogenase